MKLKPHHLLCLHGFVGLGYNHLFIENFKQIIALINDNPKLEVEVTYDYDAICLACPEEKKLMCADLNSFSQKQDRLLAEYLNIKPKEKYRINKLLALVRSKISDKNLAKFCSDCPWFSYNYCLQGIKQNNLLPSQKTSKALTSLSKNRN